MLRTYRSDPLKGVEKNPPSGLGTPSPARLRLAGFVASLLPTPPTPRKRGETGLAMGGPDCGKSETSGQKPTALDRNQRAPPSKVTPSLSNKKGRRSLRGETFGEGRGREPFQAHHGGGGLRTHNLRSKLCSEYTILFEGARWGQNRY